MDTLVKSAKYRSGNRFKAIIESCRVPVRPIMMTSLARIIGLRFGEGSESDAPLARVLIGGLLVLVTLAVLQVPAGFFLAYQNQPAASRPYAISPT
jgi:multidrug efflux pump subunit AcrB